MASLLLWAVAMYLSGLALFLVGPIAVGARLTRGWRTRIARPYSRMAQLLAGRALLMARSPGAEFVASSRDGELGEAFEADGAKRHARDDANVMGRWRQQPMGLVHPSRAVVYDVSAATLGQRARETVANDEHLSAEGYDTTVDIPQTVGFAPVGGALSIIPKSGTTRLAEMTDEYVENALAELQDSPTKQYMVLLFALIGTFGAVVLVGEFVVGGGGPVDIPTGGNNTTLPASVRYTIEEVARR